MARGNGSLDRRVSLLERLAKEDRVRWRALAKYLKAGEARWKKNDERLDAMMHEIDRQQGSIDATLKILHRLLEGTA